jgi:GTP-binding protein
VIRVALLGRPNVGKSSLFNRLAGARRALVADEPGVTRDPLEAWIDLAEGTGLTLVDTGGLDAGDDAPLAAAVGAAAFEAARTADLVLLVLDARSGPVARDHELLRRLRRAGREPVGVVNKAEGLDETAVRTEFAELALAELLVVSARRGTGLGALRGRLAACANARPEGSGEATRVVLLGRPNAGKSTLVNRLAGRARVLADPVPGTTRDAVEVAIERDGERWLFVDTAGIRRRRAGADTLERQSVRRGFDALEEADLVLLLVDARAGVHEQDVRLAAAVAERGRPRVVGLNKWDGLDESTRRLLRRDAAERFAFLGAVPVVTLSATTGSGLGGLFAALRAARRELENLDLATGPLNRVLAEALRVQAPPRGPRGERIRLRYAHPGGRRPPRVVVHGAHARLVPETFRRYLAHRFAAALGLETQGLVVDFRDDAARAARRPGAPRRGST